MIKIKTLNIKKLHGYLDVDLVFNEGLNVIHGKNGIGKTTISNIIAHIARGDIHKFVHLKFDRIDYELHNLSKYSIIQTDYEYKNNSKNHYHANVEFIDHNLESLALDNFSPLPQTKNICSYSPSRFEFKTNYLKTGEDHFWYWPANRFSLEKIEDNRKSARFDSNPFLAKSEFMTFVEILSQIKNLYINYASEKKQYHRPFIFTVNRK